MTEPRNIAGDMRVVAAIAGKLMELARAGEKPPTRIFCHPEVLVGFNTLLGLPVIHTFMLTKDMVGLTSDLVGQWPSVEPRYVIEKEEDSWRKPS